MEKFGSVKTVLGRRKSDVGTDAGYDVGTDASTAGFRVAVHEGAGSTATHQVEIISHTSGAQYTIQLVGH